ncbi:ribosome silencing factor [Thermoleophilia bacterium SCSIO 60948]|nr:ribosome silencing factor [Thermoleophilia bacterium SCSIO 60948]
MSATGSGVERIETEEKVAAARADGAGERAHDWGTSVDLVRRVAHIVDDKQGTDIVAVDVRELVSYTDVLLIATARNERLARAIVEDVRLALKHERGLLPSRTEGEADASWILVDYLDCVLHVFQPESRERYRLEQLWGEAPRVELELRESG